MMGLSIVGQRILGKVSDEYQMAQRVTETDWELVGPPAAEGPEHEALQLILDPKKRAAATKALEAEALAARKA
jgi:hypothetical protein